MAVRFHRGGKLVVFGVGGASTDAQHVAVEFVHPVIVGKRALPAISLTTDVATVTGIAERDGVAAIFAHQIRFLADPADIALGLSADGNSPSVLAGLEAARELGLRTIALAGGDGGQIAGGKAADHLWSSLGRPPGGQGAAGDRVPRAVGAGHVFFEQPGVLGPGVVTGGGTDGERRPRAWVGCASPAPTRPWRSRVLRLLEDPMAVADDGEGEETVSVALVAAGWATRSWCTPGRPSRW